jgi:hypothetical protein
MIKRTINYTDFDGNKRTEDLYFNMTKTELTEFALGMPDDMTSEATNEEKFDPEAAGRKLVEKLGKYGIFKFIKDLVFKSYGKKSEDGRRFIKSEELSTEFTQTLAYDEFMSELLSDDLKASEFINGIIPAEMAEKMPSLKSVK